MPFGLSRLQQRVVEINRKSYGLKVRGESLPNLCLLVALSLSRLPDLTDWVASAILPHMSDYGEQQLLAESRAS